MKKLLFLIPVLLFGCNSDLQEKRFLANQEYTKAVDVYTSVVDVYAKGANEVASKKFDLEETVIGQDFKDWLGTHTATEGPNKGGLVSSAPDGTVVAMPVTQLLLAMKLDSDKKARVAVARQDWTVFRSKIGDATRLMKQTNTAFKQKEIDTQEAIRSAQAIIDSSLSAVGALIGGVGTGLLIAP